MRTLFEDTTENADRQDDGAIRKLPVVMWSIALLMLVAMVGAYFFVQYQQKKQTEQKPVPVSVQDPAQAAKAINEFNQFVVAEKWDEAEKMLSNNAKTRLVQEKKTLRESLLARHLADKTKKDDKLVAAVTTESKASTENSFRIDCAYVFQGKRQDQEVIAITVIKEGERLLIDSWN